MFGFIVCNFIDCNSPKTVAQRFARAHALKTAFNTTTSGGKCNDMSSSSCRAWIQRCCFAHTEISPEHSFSLCRGGSPELHSVLIYSETGASLADVRCSCGLKTWQAQMTIEIRRSIGLSCRKVSIASQRQPVTETVTASFTWESLPDCGHDIMPESGNAQATPASEC